MQAKLELSDVKRALAAVEQEAVQNKLNVCIAVCDAGGVLLGLLRMDNAPVMSAVLAPDKARSCAMTGKPSAAFEEMVNNGRPSILSLPVLTIEGGEPIIVDGTTVGAIGVGGAKAEEDAKLALIGVKAIVDSYTGA